MKEYMILTINPGSSSTKCGIVCGNKVLLDTVVDHNKNDFAECESFADQEPIRLHAIEQALKDADIDLTKVDAVVGRGVGLYPCEGGTYKIDDLVYDHATRDVAGRHHPATLGIKIAYRFAKQLQVPAFFVNPMPTDEACDEARMTGVKGLYRQPNSHALNQKQVAIHHSELMGKKYEDCNYILLHLGGGISINAHRKGRTIDGNRAGDGQGPICPNRSGDLCVADVRELMKQGKSFDEVFELAAIKGGLIDLVGTDDLRKVEQMIASGDKFAELAYRGMVYSIIKWAAMMAGALYGQVDGILMTGGMANDKKLVDDISEGLKWIAPISVYPGSFETEAMGAGAIRVLSGQEEAKKYTGKPVWNGFSFEK